MEMFLCSKCGIKKERQFFHEFSNNNRIRPVTSWCCECRKTINRKMESYNYLFKKYKQKCNYCIFPKKMLLNGICKKCLKKQGLKYCPCCKTVKLIDFDFYSKTKLCKHCIGVKNG
jgi:hypothetical protein